MRSVIASNSDDKIFLASYVDPEIAPMSAISLLFPFYISMTSSDFAAVSVHLMQ